MRSFKLEKKIPPKKDFQKHHLIPVEVFASRSFEPLFSKIGALGFDPQDFNTNGLWLPCTETMAMESGLPLHRGSHRRYNILVSECVAALTRPGAYKSCVPRTTIEIAKKISFLQGSLRRTLLLNDNMCKVDSFNLHSDSNLFQGLDRDIAALSYDQYLS
jgi:A nuclease family of the HNH/ENDO VII superfamily with conserved AHH